MIPAFSSSNVLPPFISSPANNRDISPYESSLIEFIDRFATSANRIKIIHGLLEYRVNMKTKGITNGFQWIDGSFVENVEITRKRSPGDIDIVTFAFRPLHLMNSTDWNNFQGKCPDIFKSSLTKVNYLCDAYYIDLNANPLLIVDYTRYWYGLFSHQKVTALWKGMVQIPLSEDENYALNYLTSRGSYAP
jgi:hypothetical protein